MADPLTRAGGLVPWAENEKITSVGLTRMGSLALQLVNNGSWGRLLRASTGVDPSEGVFGSTDLVVTMTDDLESTVGIGQGFVFKAGDDYTPDFQMFALDAPVVLTHAAHDPANPRIDRVCISSAYADELAENHDVKDPVSGTISSTPEYTRRRIAAVCQVVTGTPAGSPSAPATPADYISLATVAIPAASGAGVATDTRSVVAFAIEKVAGDLEMQSGKQLKFANVLAFEDRVDMEALGLSLGNLLEVSAGGAWSVAAASDTSVPNIDGDPANFPRSRVQLSTPAANDEINIPLDKYVRPGCGLSRVILIAEADQGTVTMDAQLGYNTHTGTTGAPTQLAISNTQAVADAQRRKVELTLDPDAALVHGVDHADGSRFYNLRLRVTATSGSPGILTLYGIILCWSTTSSRAAWGYTAA